MKPILLALILIFSTVPVSAAIQQGFFAMEDRGRIYPLKGNLKFHYGDNPEWSAPSYDDSRWELRKFPSWIPVPQGSGHPGFYWYRLHFTVHRRVLDQGPLFVSINRGIRCYELSINGTRIGKLGEFPSPDTKWRWGLGSGHWIIPNNVLDARGVNVLAIRVFEGFSAFDHVIFRHGQIGPYAVRGNTLLYSTLIYVSIATIILFIAFFHLNAYRKNLTRETLWFSLFGISVAISILLSWSHDIIPDDYITPGVALSFFFYYLSFNVFCLFIYYFFNHYFSGFKKWYFGLLLIPCIVMLIIPFIDNIFFLDVAYFSLMAVLVLSYPLFCILLSRELVNQGRYVLPVLVGSTVYIGSIIIDYLPIFNVEFIELPVYFYSTNSAGILVYIASMAISIQKKQFVMQEKYHKGGPKRQDFLKGIDADAIRRDLHKLMQQDALYRDDTIKMHQVAALLSISPRSFSEFLNRELHCNFHAYINGFRIAEAKQLLLDDPDAPVVGIAYQVGFNSLSKFYAAFKTQTGMRPLDYRKNPHS